MGNAGVYDSATGSFTFTPNALNQYNPGASLSVTNGAAHEVANFDSVSYQYIGDTHLSRVTLGTNVYELGYDALGRCVRRRSNPDQSGAGGVSSYYVYDGERPIIEYNNTGTITARNTYGIGIDEILARDAGALFYHQDRIGNVSAVTNASGQVIEQYRYDAFGQPEIRSGPFAGNPDGELQSGTLVNNRFLFTGREWVAQYGFYEYRNRAYNPRLGRFMSEDPLGLQMRGAKPRAGMFPNLASGQMPKEFAASEGNLFAYCHNDPVNKSDPFGLETKIYPGGESDWAANYNPTDRTVLVAHGNPRQGAVNTVANKIITAETLVKDAIAKGFSESKPKVDLSICGAGVGGKDSLAQKVANGLAATGVKPDVSAVNGNTANEAFKNDRTGAIRSEPLRGAPDPNTKGTTGEVKHFTADPSDKKKDK